MKRVTFDPKQVSLLICIGHEDILEFVKQPVYRFRILFEMQEFERIDNFKILQASFRKLSIEKVKLIWKVYEITQVGHG